MATPTVEQDVILDADGRPLFSALEFVQREIAKIQRQVSLIQRDSFKAADDFGKTVAARARELQTLTSQIRTLSTARNTPGGSIQDLNSEARLAASTRAATAFGRELNVARNAAEALDAKIAGINRRIAERGRNGQFATFVQTDQLQKLEQARTMLGTLDKDFQRLQLTARRTGRDFSTEINGVLTARERLTSAALNPRRVNLGMEMTALSDAQARLAERIADARAREARSSAEGFRARRESAIGEVNQMRGIMEFERARVITNARIVELRTQLKTATADERRGLLEALELEKARAGAIRTNIAEQNRAARAAGGAGGGAGTPGMFGGVAGSGRTAVQNILSPGYAAAAFARTSVYGLAATAAYALFNAISGGIHFVVQLEDELHRLQAISNSTDTEMVQLKNSILDVAGSSRFSTIEITQIAQTLAQAGVSASQMRPVLESVLALATASGSTATEAVNLVTSALGSFQLQASEAGRIADLLTSALNRTRLTVSQVGEAIQYVGATAYEQNITFEQLLSTIGAISQAGIRSGSTIGTGFRQFLIDLQNPSKRLTDQLTLLGLTSADVDVSVRGLSAVLQTLRERGFGASQAYAGLETRAAAFYLVAKNNVDVMAQLQLAFAQNGAAATANERALGSVSAKWQQFLNVLGRFVDILAGPVMHVVGNLLSTFSGIVGGINSMLGAIGSISRGVQEFGQVFGDVFITTIAGYFIGGPWGAAIGAIYSLGSSLLNTTSMTARAQAAVEQYATATSQAAAITQQHSDKVDALTHEINRLVTQQDSLRQQTVQVSAETVSLSSRFEGLGLQLVGRTHDVYGLIDALRSLRRQELENQRVSIAGEIAAGRNERGSRVDLLRSQMNDVIAQAGGRPPAELGARQQLAFGHIVRDYLPEFFRTYGPNVQGQINQYAARNPISTSVSILADAANRLQSTNQELARRLNAVVATTGQIAGIDSTLNANIQRGADLGAAASPENNALQPLVEEIQALVTQLGSATGDQKRELTARANGLIDLLLNDQIPDQIRTAQARNNQALVRLLLGTTADVQSLKRQVNAANTDLSTPHTEQRALITRQDIITAVRQVVPNAQIGSGYRSPEHQDALHRAGVTPATGSTSAHSTGTAQDFPIARMSREAGDRLANQIKAHLREQGIDADVRYESGQGRNQGTGSHIHVGVRRNQRFSGGQTSGSIAQVRDDISNDQLRLSNLDADYRDKLKDLNRATSAAVLDGAITSAQSALTAWSQQLRDTTENKIAAEGLTANQATARRQEIEAQISQRVEEFQQKLIDAIIGNVRRQLEVAQRAFDNAMRPAQSELARLQAQLQGLSAPSLNNRVPDYVTQLAQRRVANQEEVVARTRASLLPELISTEERAIREATERLAAHQRAVERVAAATETTAVAAQTTATAATTTAREAPFFGAGAPLSVEDRRGQYPTRPGARPTGAPTTISPAVQAAVTAVASRPGPAIFLDPAQMEQTLQTLGQLTDGVTALRNEKAALDAQLGASGLLPTTYAQGLNQAIEAFRLIHRETGNFQQEFIYNIGGALEALNQGFTEFFANITNGSKSVLQAFGDFARGIINYISQIAAQMLASQIMKTLFSLLGAAAGSASGATASASPGDAAAIGWANVFGKYDGGPAIPGYDRGGQVTNGDDRRDSVKIRVAKGEWIIRRAAAQSIGPEGMAQLNRYGSKALQGMRQTMPQIQMVPKQEMAVYVISPDHKPSLTKNDIIVTLQDDILQGGQTKKLIKFVAQEGN